MTRHACSRRCARDEASFAQLVDGYRPTLLRLALAHVPSRAVAEEVVQETWLAVLDGLDRFEGRSSLRTWIASSCSTRPAPAASASGGPCQSRSCPPPRGRSR